MEPQTHSSSFAVKPGNKVLFTGDSITDCDRRGSNAPLGQGYVRMVADLIAAKHPTHHCTFVNTGIGGNNIRNLFDRWTDDVIRHQPDWVSILIGINDVNSWLASNQSATLSPENFAHHYSLLLERVRKETKAQIVLMDPFYVSTDVQMTGGGDWGGSWRAYLAQHLPQYIQVVHDMAAKCEARHVRTHELFQERLKYFPPDRFAPEPVHPNPSGHLLMAYEWLRVMGF